MATIDWPVSLPVAQDGSLVEGYFESFVSDQPEVGAPRRRKRFTRALRRFSFTMVLTTAQVATLRTFIDTTSDRGVLEFNWTHPITAVAYEMRFDGLPEIRHMTAGNWEVSVTMNEI